jgi:two-component system chemotaxis response regulator CheY
MALPLSTSSESYSGTLRCRRNRVLIVDDNCYVRELLSEIFKRELDFEVCGEAGDGREAVHIAQLSNPDLVILDLSMPVMNGLDAARVLRRQNPEASLIMYCGFGDKFVEQQAHLIGISALVSKAEPPGTLVNKARMVLNRKPEPIPVSKRQQTP